MAATAVYDARLGETWGLAMRIGGSEPGRHEVGRRDAAVDRSAKAEPVAMDRVESPKPSTPQASLALIPDPTRGEPAASPSSDVVAEVIALLERQEILDRRSPDAARTARPAPRSAATTAATGTSATATASAAASSASAAASGPTPGWLHAAITAGKDVTPSNVASLIEDLINNEALTPGFEQTGSAYSAATLRAAYEAGLPLQIGETSRWVLNGKIYDTGDQWQRHLLLNPSAPGHLERNREYIQAYAPYVGMTPKMQAFMAATGGV